MGVSDHDIIGIFIIILRNFDLMQTNIAIHKMTYSSKPLAHFA